MTLDTGERRSVVGHAISGAVAGAVISGCANSIKVKNGVIDNKEAIRGTIKNAISSAIVSATAIGVANCVGNPNKGIFSIIGTAALGSFALYTVESKYKESLQNISNKVIIED